ncbi:MAG: hypothetical protein ACLRY6_07035 [[Clostridium] innocuum]
MKTIYDTGKRTSELLQDLKQLVEIPSVRDERTAGIICPVWQRDTECNGCLPADCSAGGL